MCIVTNSERMAWTRPAPRPAASTQPQEAQHAPSMEEERQRRKGEQTDGHGQHLPQHASEWEHGQHSARPPAEPAAPQRPAPADTTPPPVLPPASHPAHQINATSQEAPAASRPDRDRPPDRSQERRRGGRQGKREGEAQKRPASRRQSHIYRTPPHLPPEGAASPPAVVPCPSVSQPLPPAVLPSL